VKLTIPAAALVRELSLLQGVVEKKTTIPILSSVRLDAAAGLTIAGTNLEQAVTSRVECSVQEPGAICLPAVRLLNLARALTGDITIKTDDKHYATITAGRSRSRIAGQSTESWPELPTPPEPVAELDARVFSRHMESVAFAISAEESRFTLNGALLEFDGSILRAVATDGHRMAHAEVDAATCPTPLKLLYPRQAITAYAKLADAAEGGARVALATDDNHIFLTVGPRILTARKLTGNFPDYRRVLPNHETHITVDREEFKAALERVAQFSDERSRAARFAFKDGEILLAAQSIETGESEESVPCEGGVNMEMGFNASYILDALRTITHPRVAVFLRDAKSATELRPMAGAGTEQDPYMVGTGYRVIVMPMRVN
jgi:DNA polymerase-3 subunit beta